MYNFTVGKPIAVPKVANPSNSIIDEYHRIFFEALRELFDEHKQAFDPEGSNAQLTMVSWDVKTAGDFTDGLILQIEICWSFK